MVEEFNAKVRDCFGEVSIEKSLYIKSGLKDLSIPAFVAEWIIDHECSEGSILEEAKKAIHDFVRNHLPRKDQKENIRNALANGETRTLIDHFSVSVDLKRQRKILRIPCIDETGFVEEWIIDKNPRLLGAGIWGAGKLTYHPPSEDLRAQGEVWLTDFRPLQAKHIDMELFFEQRDAFTLQEWRNLLLTSMGYNPNWYHLEDEQMLLLGRLLPIVHNRVNIIELAPKGTGKSFLYSNLSRYARLLSGGKTTAAALFYNLATNEPGLLTLYDLLAFDEAKTISFDNPGEVIGVLKDYLESGRYTRGRQLATASAGVAILGNIEIAADGKPINRVLFRELPEFLQETAFIARFHALLPGWEIRKFSPNSEATGIGLKADFFGEVLHRMRDLAVHGEFVQRKLKIRGSDDIRDVTAVQRVATAYLKLLFPSLKLTDEEFHRYCVNPALRLRQMVCDQLAAMDAEYPTVRLEASVLGTNH